MSDCIYLLMKYVCLKVNLIANSIMFCRKLIDSYIFFFGENCYGWKKIVLCYASLHMSRLLLLFSFTADILLGLFFLVFHYINVSNVLETLPWN